MFNYILKPFLWVKDRIKHKLEHFSIAHLKEVFRKHGTALLVIFIAWEIIEDVMFPLLFIWLGNNVNPWFLTGAPVSWLLCLHPIMVPVTWGFWIRLKGGEADDG